MSDASGPAPAPEGWGVPEEPQAAPAPDGWGVPEAPAPAETPTDDDIDNRVRALFDAGIREAPGSTGAYEIAKKTGAPLDMVKARYEEFKASAERAKFDPRQWRQSNPDLYEFLITKPYMAPAVFKEKKIANFKYDMDFAAQPLLMGEDFFAGDVTIRKETRQYQDKSELTAFEAAKDVAGTALKQNKIAKRGAWQMVLDIRDPNSPSAVEHREQILREQQEIGLPSHYGSSPLGEMGLKTLEAVMGQADSGVALVFGTAVGAVTRNPAITVATIKALSAGASFTTEAGGAYLEFRDAKDDKGKRVDPGIAAAAAVLYGIGASTIELASLGPMLKGFGPLGQAIAEGQGRAWMMKALTDRTKQGVFRSIAKDIAKSAAAEGGEESSQELFNIAMGWVARSWSAGTVQKFDPEGDAKERVIGSGAMGMLGGLFGIGSAQALVSLAQQSFAVNQSREAGAKVAAINKLADSDVARAAPKSVAEFIEAQSAKTGQKVTHLYIDPVRLVEEIKRGGGDPQEAARELMGDAGPQRLQDALVEAEASTEARATLEVPVAEYLERWGGKPIAEAIAEDVTTGSGLRTKREETLFQSNVGKVAKDLVAQQEKEEAGEQAEAAVDVGPFEKRFASEMESQLVATGRMTRQEARYSVATHRAIIRTMLARSPKAAEAVFQQSLMSVGLDLEETLGPPQAARHLAAALKEMTPEQKAQVQWLDSNTGTYNERAFRQLATDPARLLSRYKFEGTKWKNKQGHTPGNELYRLVGQALNAIADDAAKWGGDFVSTVASAEEAQGNAQRLTEAVRDRLRALNPEVADQIRGLEIVATTAPLADGLDTALDLTAQDADALTDQMEAETRRAKRGEKPFGLPMANAADLKLSSDPAAMRELSESLRQRAAEMTDEQIFNESYLGRLPGMLSREAFFALPKRAHVVSIDLNGLKAINSAHGRAMGDEVLRQFADIAKIAGGSGMDMAHLSGDEFAAQTDDPVLAQLFVDILGELAQGIQVEAKSGEVINGVTFGYGIGDTYDAADARVEEHKQREKAEPGAEQRARRVRAENLRQGSVPDGGRKEVLAEGTRPQAYPRRGRRRRGSDPKAAAEAAVQRRIDQARLRALRSIDPAEVAQRLSQAASLEAQALARTTLSRLGTRYPRAPKFGSVGQAWRTIAAVSFPDGAWESEQADSQYGKAVEGRAEMPGPYAGDTFGGVNAFLGLTGKKRVKGARHAFEQLVKHFTSEGQKEWDAAESAIGVLREAVGFEGLRLPDEVAMAKVEAEAADEMKERTSEEYEDVDTSFDPDDIEGKNYYQPAFHGSRMPIVETLYQANAIRTGRDTPLSGRQAPGPLWRSAVERAASAAKQAKNTPQAWLSLIQKTPGVRKEEIEWLGLDRWLGDHAGPLTREQVIEFIRANQIEVTEQVHGELRPESIAAVEEAYRDASGKWTGMGARSDRIDGAFPDNEPFEYDGNTDFDAIERERQRLERAISSEETEIESLREDLEGADREERDSIEERIEASEAALDGARSDMNSLPPEWAVDEARAHVRKESEFADEAQSLGQRAMELFREGKYDEAFEAAQDAGKLEFQHGGGLHWESLAETIANATAGVAPQYEEYTLGGHTAGSYKELLFYAPGTPAREFRAQHFGDDAGRGLLAHARITEHVTADGKPILFIEEVQSDLHQGGREKGYERRLGQSRRDGLTEARRGFIEAALLIGIDKRGADIAASGLQLRQSLPEDNVQAALDMGLTKEAAGTLLAPAQRLYDIGERRHSQERRAPEAPFKTTWDELVAKRLIRWAAEKGYEQIGWTTGEQQARRYDLSRRVRKLSWRRELAADGRSTYALTAYDLEGDPIPGLGSLFGADELPGVVGVEMARKIVESPESSDTFWGEDLRIGGEGMSVFYDQRLASVFRGLTKKHGGVVEKKMLVGLPDIEDPESGEMVVNRPEVWTVDIPEPLREQALDEGMTLFQAKTLRRRDLQRDAIDAAEDEIRHLPRERVIVADKDGSILAKIDGESDHVQIPGDVISVIHDTLFTHNHPTGQSLSAEDVSLAVYANVKEMRATVPDGGAWVLRRPDDGWGIPEDKIREFITGAHAASKVGTQIASRRMDQEIIAAGDKPGDRSSKGYSDEKWKQFVSEERNKQFVLLAESYGAKWQPEFESAEQRSERLAGQRPDAGQGRGADLPGQLELFQGGRGVDTPEFKRWFGDSKVVDENGKPLRVYHGTGNAEGLTAFDPALTGQGNDQLGSGFYFTTDPTEASGYTTAVTSAAGPGATKLGGDQSPGVVPAFLSIKNPLRVKGSNLRDTDVDMTAEQAAEILRRSPRIYDVVDTPLWNFVDIGDGPVTDDMIVEAAQSYTGPSLMSLENDFFGRPGDAEVYRAALRDVLGYDGVVLEFEGGKKHWVAWFPEQIKSATGNRGAFDPNDPDILSQPKSVERLNKFDDDIKRGLIEIAVEGTRRAFRIFLTEKSDLSTFLHESAHAYLEMLGDMAEHPEADDRLRKDYATVLKWLGVKDRADLTVDHKEKWARGFEAYLMEGKAPSSALAEAFATFKLWLTQVYRSIRELEVDLTPAIRGVFDRMLATDGEIERMKAAAGLDVPLWKTHTEAGMTPEEWSRYLDERRRTTTHTAMMVQRRIAEAQLKATEAFKTAEFAKIKEQAEDEWEDRQDWRAWRYILRGERRLSDGRIIRDKVFGKLDREELSKIVDNDSEMVKKLRGRIAKEGGEHPTTVAREFGFANGKAMLEAIAALPDRDSTIQARAEEMMREKHPEIDGELVRLHEYMQKTLHNEMTAEWLIKEYSALGRKTAPEGTAAGELANEGAKEAARRLVAKRRVGRLDVGQALNSERAMANQAAIEVAKGEYRKARETKLRQMLYHHMWRELDKVTGERDRFEALVAKLGDRKRREILGRAGKEFLEASDQILEALGLRKFEDTGEDRVSIEQAAGALAIDGGPAFDVVELSKIVAKPQEHGWRDLSVEQMRLVHQALAQFYTVAQNKSTLILEGQRRQVQDLADVIDTEASVRPDLGPVDRKPHRWAGVMAQLLEPREVIRRLGQTAYKVLWTDGYVQAEKSEDALLKKVGKFFAESWDKLPKALQARRFEMLDDLDGVEWPDDVDRQPTFDRQWMWMIALNMGNRSNRDRLLGGYQWKEGAVLDWLNRNMTQEEWGFVESVWKLLDEELYPEVAKAYEEATGLPPDKIPPTPIQTPFGVVRGGYFPARYDVVASRLGATQSLENLQKSYGQNPGQISVAKGFTKSRARRYTDIIDLDWNVVPSHILSVVHYVAFDRFVRQARALLTNRTFAETVRHRLGEKHYANLIDTDAGWLAMVSSSASDAVPRNLRDLYYGLGVSKKALVNSAIGWSIKTAAGDIVEPIKVAFTGKVKLRYAMQSMAKAYSVGYGPMRRQALEKSHAVRHRAEDVRRRVRAQLEDIGQEGRRTAAVRWLNKVQDSAFWFLERSDRLVSTIVWDAAYTQSLSAGNSEADAIVEADDAVVSSLPVQDTVLKPALLRDKRGVAQLLVFFGYFSKTYNQVAAMLDPVLVEWDNAEGVGEKAAAAVPLALKAGQVMAMLAVAQVMAEFVQGRGPEEDEEWPEWAIRKILAGPFLLFPFIGQFAEEGINRAVSAAFDGDAKSRPINVRSGFILEALKRAWRAVEKASDEDRGDGQRVLDVLEFLGVVTATPTGSAQFRRTADYALEGLE